MLNLPDSTEHQFTILIHLGKETRQNTIASTEHYFADNSIANVLDSTQYQFMVFQHNLDSTEHYFIQLFCLLLEKLMTLLSTRFLFILFNFAQTLPSTTSPAIYAAPVYSFVLYLLITIILYSRCQTLLSTSSCFYNIIQTLLSTTLANSSFYQYKN